MLITGAVDGTAETVGVSFQALKPVNQFNPSDIAQDNPSFPCDRSHFLKRHQSHPPIR